MKISARLFAMLVCTGLGWMAVSASADTLQMKDGHVIQGRFFGGTQASVQFETKGRIELYNVDDIISVTFTNAPSASSPPPAGPPTPAAAPTPPPAPAVSTWSGPTGTAAASAGSITVPAGTDILVRMIDSVNSDKNNIGDRFRASLEQDFVVDGIVIAPKGTDVYGRLSEAKEAGHMAGKSQLKLELTDILIRNRLQPIMTGEYEVSGSSRGSDTAKKVGIGAVAGTVIGAIAGGGKGAAIGAGVGAGAGAAVQVMTKGEQVHVPSETLLDFRIAQPFLVSTMGQ
jgi:YmgG-like glycine-zipper protein